MDVKRCFIRFSGVRLCCAEGNDAWHDLDSIVVAVAIGLDGIRDILRGEMWELAAQVVTAETLTRPECDALDVTFAQDEAQVSSLGAAGPAAYDTHVRAHEDGLLEALTEGRELGQGFGDIRHDTPQRKAAVDGEWDVMRPRGRFGWGVGLPWIALLLSLLIISSGRG